MSERDNIRREFEEKSPKLFCIEKKEPFEAPENYFEELPRKVQERIAQKESAKDKNFAPFPIWVPTLAAAMLLLFIGLFMFKPFATETQLADNPSEEIFANDSAFSDDLMAYYSEEEVAENVDVNFMLETLIYGEDSRNPTAKVSAVSYVSPQLEEYILDNVDENLLTETL